MTGPVSAAAGVEGEGVGDPGTTRRRDHTFVVVNHPYQVVHQGFVFGPGEVADVPEDVALHWITCGWVVPQ